MSSVIINLFYLSFITIILRICHGNQLKNGYILSLDSNNLQVYTNWRLHNGDTSTSIAGNVPGGIYSDLMKSGNIGDVFLGDEDVKTRKYANLSWIYECTFDMPFDVQIKNITNIVFYGVDTLADVTVNGKYVGSTNNMFTRYVFPVEVKTTNNIRVEFKSPIKIADALDEKYPTAPRCVPDIYQGECHANQLRKMQASFSWDWGPAFPSMGLWKSVHLEIYNSAIIRDLTVDIQYLDLKWLVKIKIYMESKPLKDLQNSYIKSQLNLGKNTDVIAFKELNGTVRIDGTYETSIELEVSDSKVKKWWPNGLGDQPLYNLTVMYSDSRYLDEQNSKTIKIAFRDIKFVEDLLCEKRNAEGKEIEASHNEDLNCDGREFYFNVNGYAVFMKGTNWIPASILPEFGYNEQVVDSLLQSVKDTYMNMLRVWGGGVYESDYFYAKCDELGILVWQDFMFACAMYPDYEEFLSSVSEEVQQNVRRLQHHPSVAIWAGNNENEAALRGNWYDTEEEFDRYKSQYINLYVKTIRPIVVDNDPTRHYLISSPTNGIESESEGYIAKNPYDPHYGDTHYYNYIGPLWSTSTYPYTRFASEYGFQSYPSMYTLSTAGVKSTSGAYDLMKHRQHSPAGESSMALQIGTYLKSSMNQTSKELSREVIYYSQIVQAESMKVETEFYRQSRYDWRTMGALYWQLNDVWQTPSWSSVEFTGRWKMLHYFARKFFAPVLISPRITPEKSIEVYVINDLLKPLECKVAFEIFQWGNKTPLQTQKFDIILNMTSVSKLSYQYKLPEGQNLNFFRYQLMDHNDVVISPFNYIFPFKPKDINKDNNIEKDIQIFTSLKKIDGKMKSFSVDVYSESMYLYVFLEVDFQGHFSDNGFHLIDSPVQLTFQTMMDVDVNRLRSDIIIQTIPYNIKIKSL